MKPQLLISAITAGNGKTLFSMGLLRALKKRGLKVQPYKCGPDFIDSQLLTIAADRESVNLDTWMASHTHVQHLYNKYGEQADVCITEGVGGLFDGYRRMQGSSAEMAGLLNLPVILLVNARNAGYSVAPIWFQELLSWSAHCWSRFQSSVFFQSLCLSARCMFGCECGLFGICAEHGYSQDFFQIQCHLNG